MISNISEKLFLKIDIYYLDAVLHSLNIINYPVIHYYPSKKTINYSGSNRIFIKKEKKSFFCPLSGLRGQSLGEMSLKRFFYAVPISKVDHVNKERTEQIIKPSSQNPLNIRLGFRNYHFELESKMLYFLPVKVQLLGRTKVQLKKVQVVYLINIFSNDTGLRID